MRTEPHSSGSAFFERCCRVILLLTCCLAFWAVRPAAASHINIVVDGDLTDLITAVNANLGGANGGFAASDPLGDIYTGPCAYVNGYDIRQTYALFDFRDSMGNLSPMDVTLYLGWIVEGNIGDVDGNGNPDTYSIGSPGGSSGCALSDEPGIGPNESYNLLLDLDCTGAVDDVRIAVKNNIVAVVQGATLIPLAGATFAKSGHNLEVKIPNYQNLLNVAKITGQDLCNAKVRQTANAEFDGPGEDFVSPPFQLEVPPQVGITKTPPTQEVCAGQNANWTITVRNNGLCLLTSFTVYDTLQTGMTFVSSTPPSVGNAQMRSWDFPDINLEPGQTQVITLTAQLGAPCTSETLVNRVTVEAVHTSTCLAQPTAANASTSASVTCVEACAIITTTPDRIAACPGATVQVPFTVTSCSDRPQTITYSATCNGTPVATNLVVALPANGQVVVNVPCTLPESCEGLINVAFTGSVNVDGFESCNVPLTANKNIECFNPCLTIRAIDDKLRACAGADVVAGFYVKNCGIDPLALGLDSSCGDMIPVTITAIPATLNPGDSVLVNVTCRLPAECNPNGNYVVSLSGRGTIVGADCYDEDTATTEVNCVEACLTVEFNRGPNAACAGDTFSVVFDVRNCSTTDSEQITLAGFCNQMGALSVTPSMLTLAPNSQQEVTVTCVMPAECEGDISVRLDASAQVIGLQGPGCVVERSQAHTVECHDVCLTALAPNDTTICAGDLYTGSFKISNCNFNDIRLRGMTRPVSIGDAAGVAPLSQSYVLTATCDGMPVAVTPNQFILGAGGMQNVSVSCQMPEVCDGPRTIVLKAVAALVEDPTCIDSTTVDVTVNCVEACVELTCPTDEPLAACVMDTVSVLFDAKNCNTMGRNEILSWFAKVSNAQLLDITPSSPQSVAAGQSVPVTVRIIMPAECAGDATVEMALSGYIEGDDACTDETNITKTIRCVEPCIDVRAQTEPVLVCVPGTGNAIFDVQNCSTEIEVVNFTALCNGMAATAVPPNAVLQPGQTIQVTVACSLETCVSPTAPFTVNLKADAYVQGDPNCNISDNDNKNVNCTQPCVDVVVENIPTSICAGDTADISFGLSNCNPGQSENITWQVYCGGMLVDSDQVTVVGSGVSQLLLVRCAIPDTCEGDVPVRIIGTAQVVGFPASCSDADTADAVIDCLKPCIDVVAPPPIEACAGSVRIPVDFKLTSCSQEAQSYYCVIYCDGVPQNLDSASGAIIQPGEMDTLHTFCSLPAECDGDVDVKILVYATIIDPASNEILRGCTVVDSAETQIQCVEACVEVIPTPETGPYAGCAGDTVDVSFTVNNCGDHDESIALTATCNGNPVANITTPINIPAGGSTVVLVPCVLPLECDGVLLVTLNATATIPGLQGEGCTDFATAGRGVECLTPCLIVSATTDSLSGCAGDTVDVAFKVTNCSPDQRNEIITVTALCDGMPIVIGPQNVVLAPGGMMEYIVPCVLPVDCDGDVYVSLTATAAIEGYPDCNKAMTVTKPIGCAEGCVEVVSCQEEVLACNGSSVVVPFVVRNCTGATEEVVTVSATCDGDPVILPISTFTIGAGDSVIVNVPCTMPDWCMGPVEVKLTANARKSGDIETACPAMDMAICPVQCVEACVTSCERFEGKVCPGDSVCVPFEIQNCTEVADEILTFKVKCGSGPIMDLPITIKLGPGEKDTICVPCRVPDICDPNGFKVILTTFASIPGLEACEFKDHAEAILECGTICVAVNDPPALEGCPGDTVEVPFNVSNCGDVAIDINMMAACNGMLTDAVEPHHFVLNPGQSIVSIVSCIIPEDCKPGEYLTVVNSAWAKGVGGDGGCAMDIAGDTRIYCIPCETEGGCGPIAINAPPGAEGCPGDALQFQFTVENQGQAPIDVAITTPTPGWTFVPNNFNDLPSGVPTNVTAYGTAPADYNMSQQLVICAAAMIENVACDTTKDYVNITSKKILFQVEKTADPDTVTAINSTSRITIRVASYKESGPLNPINVVDYMPEGISFAGNVSSTCGVTTDADPGATCVMFSPFNLAPGTSCTISFDVTCSMDGAYVDTAYVTAYCAGSQTSFRKLHDTASVVCKEARTACPRTRGFWRQQSAQKDNGSRKICAVDAGDGMDMYRLWRGVIDMTDLTSFKTNDGGTVLVSDLRNLTDQELFDALGCELEGPNPNTQRDQAETQYLTLMLNVKMGLIGLDIHVDNGTFMGTVGDAIDAVEAILNNPGSTNGQLSGAIDIADKINNRQGLMAQTCPGGENAPFGGYANSCPAGNVGFVCPDDDAPGHVDNTGSPAAGRFSLAAFPNPFNPTALLRWSVPSRMLGQRGVIEVFDATGRAVAQVFEGTVSNEQNETLLAPDGWASGMYIARLTVGTESIVYRMVLVK